MCSLRDKVQVNEHCLGRGVLLSKTLNEVALFCRPLWVHINVKIFIPVREVSAYFTTVTDI